MPQQQQPAPTGTPVPPLPINELNELRGMLDVRLQRIEAVLDVVLDSLQRIEAAAPADADTPDTTAAADTSESSSTVSGVLLP